MRQATCVLLVAAVVSVAWADDPVVFRSDVSLIRVDAQVVDRENRAITGLGIGDFVLRDQGIPQKIQSVDSENLPVDVALLLDVSSSMRPHIQRIAVASREAMRQLRDRDRVALLVFDRQMRVRMSFRDSQSGVDRELERLLNSETFQGGTDITGALLDAADFLRREGRRDARKAIVIVTDDQTELYRNVEGVSRALTRADTVLSALIAPDAGRGGYPGGYGSPGGAGGGLGGIIFGQPGGRRGRYPAGGQVNGHTQSAGTEEIARESGGDSMRVDDPYGLQDTLARIRQRYAIHFYQPEGVRPGDEREIDLQLTDGLMRRYPGADIRYRRSYYASSTTTGAVPANGYPVVVSRSGSSEDPDRPRLVRRPAAGPGASSHDGPLVLGGASGAPAPSPSKPAVAAPAPSAPPSDPTAPGWRKARPEDLQTQPSK